MKAKHFNLLMLSILLSSCSIDFLPSPNSNKKEDSSILNTSDIISRRDISESVNSAKESVEESISEISIISSNDSVNEQALTNAKALAVQEISNFVSFSKYREAQKKEVADYIEQAVRIIENCKKIDDVYYFLELYEGYIMEVKTDAQLKEIALSNCITTEQISEYKAKGYKNLYKDCNYKKGYIVTKTEQIPGSNFYHDEYLNPFKSSVTPAWTIAQWSSKYDLMGTDSNGGYTLTQDEDGVVNTFTSKGKTVDGKFVPGKVITANSKTGELYLECNTSVEYDQPRTGSEGWVHLLYSQDFGDNLINVSDCRSIVMEAEFTINKCENHTGKAYNTSRHAAQLVWYLTLQNRSGGYSNPDFGKYIWFGIGLWDNRSVGKTVDMYRAHDAGTDTLIYNPSSTEYYQDTNGIQPDVGTKIKALVDIRPIAKTAYDYAKQNGYLGNTQFEDLYIGGTNFGYEVPGTFDISSTIHKINVFYK